MGAISRKRYRKFVVHEPSRARRSGGFFFSAAGLVRKSPAHAGNGRPGSRGLRGNARARSAGPAGGNGATNRGPPMAGRTKKGSLRWRAMFKSAATEFVFQFWPPFRGHRVPGGDEFRYFVQVEGLRATEALLFPWKPLPALSRELINTLVVKRSDTSYLEKRVRIPPLASRTVEAASRGLSCRGFGSFARKNLRWRPLKTGFACSPACSIELPVVKSPVSSGSGRRSYARAPGLCESTDQTTAVPR